jgi:hypothetical protein
MRSILFTSSEVGMYSLLVAIGSGCHWMPLLAPGLASLLTVSADLYHSHWHSPSSANVT